MPRKKVDFSGWKNIHENNGGVKIGNDGTMNDISLAKSKTRKVQAFSHPGDFRGSLPKVSFVINSRFFLKKMLFYQN